MGVRLKPMPNVTLHLVLAGRVLDRWRTVAPGRAPFDPADPSLRTAFYQGSWGPDLGYFPGGHPFLSDLAHYVRTGELTRTLVRSARTPTERAFAQGWLTHVLADQAIHPIIGSAVHERVHGDRDGFVPAVDAKPTHVRLEVGLDARYSHRHPELGRFRPEPVFDRGSIRWLAEAYRSVYGLEIDRDLFLSSHHAATRMGARALLTVGGLGAALHDGLPGPAVATGRWVLRQALRATLDALQREVWMLIFLNPIPAGGWLLEETERVVEGFPDRFGRAVEGGLDGLPDYNLDSGEVEGDAPRHPWTIRTRRVLERLPRRYTGVTP